MRGTLEPNLNAPQIDAVILKGGLDQVTPTLSLVSGALRQSLNFEASTNGGYSRIVGYERFDGHPSPASSSEAGLHRYISVAAFINTPAVGNTLAASGGAIGVIAFVSGLIMVVTKSTGTWATGQTVSVGATLIGTVDNVYAGPINPEQDALAKNAVADIYRADIAAVPGEGPVRGVVKFNDVVYAIRDKPATSLAGLYKSSSSGWQEVELLAYVNFTNGGTSIPVEDQSLDQALKSATIKRVVRTDGSWAAGTAEGMLFYSDMAGGTFSAGSATISGITVTIASVSASGPALANGGRYEFIEHNFYGQAATNRIYGCNGVGQAFEFDGAILVPLPMFQATHLVSHRNYLFAAVGSSCFYSSPGDPYDWTAIGGAGEIATGKVVTGMMSLPGGTGIATLSIFSRNNIEILYGNSPTTWNLVNFDNGNGAVDYTLQNMAQTMAFDDRGIKAIQATQDYGNFTQSSLTTAVQHFIDQNINKASGSTLCRRKSQYRLFFNNGWGLFLTMVNNKIMGCMPIKFPHPVTCCYEGKRSDGTDVMFFGSTNGMVYQMEKGTSFDGDEIDWHFTTNYGSAKSPRTLKRYRKAIPEFSAENNTFVAFDFSYLLGYDSPEYDQPNKTGYSQYNGEIRWDRFTWDNFFWDGNRYLPVECPLDGTAENIAFSISGSSDYVPSFTINSILVHYSPRRQKR